MNIISAIFLGEQADIFMTFYWMDWSSVNASPFNCVASCWVVTRNMSAWPFHYVIYVVVFAFRHFILLCFASHCMKIVVFAFNLFIVLPVVFFGNYRENSAFLLRYVSLCSFVVRVGFTFRLFISLCLVWL